MGSKKWAPGGVVDARPKDERVPAEVRRALVQVMGCDPTDVALDTRLVTGLGMDDLDAVELLMALEDEYAFSMADDDVDLPEGWQHETATVQTILDTLRKAGVKL